MAKSGVIYKLTSPSGKIYVGQTTDLERRLRRYKNLMNYKGRKQPKLFYAIKKHGWDSFVVEILERSISECFLDEKEVEYIEKFDSYRGKHGLNCTAGGKTPRGEEHPRFGKKHSEEAKRKISKSKKGQKASLETRDKISKARKGKKQPNISKAQQGKKRKPFSKEHLENMRLAQKARRLRERTLEVL